ncbi:MAG: hypothetical protein GTO63_11535, partial [Anaerolineae bacterium]|nr:hypothetical protein [Anaerolineae bacterium]NIN95492.1 hypothetical protein [Anaerolineae bacterium]NIQ78476.1 hypothetical protein [Anaerolineae bacterium]
CKEHSPLTLRVHSIGEWYEHCMGCGHTKGITEEEAQAMGEAQKEAEQRMGRRFTL